MLELKGLGKSFNGLEVFRDLNLSIKNGEVVGIFGPNGGGKSTLMKCVAGFLKPDSGKIYFEGIDITGWKPHRIAKLGIAYAFQKPELFPNLRVEENIAIPLIVRGRSKGEALQIARNMLEELGFSEIVGKKVKQLSQGEEKIVEILKVLSLDTRLLLLDEPFAALDAERVKVVLKMIRSMKSQRALVITAHRPKILEKVADRLFEMKDKKIYEVK